MAEQYCIYCGARLKEIQAQETAAKPNLPSFSQREQEVIRLILSGYTEGQMASALFISVGTVKTYKRNIFKKLGIHSRRELFSAIYGGAFSLAIPGEASAPLSTRPLFCTACGQPILPEAHYCSACGQKIYP